jgi:vacuolar-type H+-ATPase subunit H
MTNDPVQLIKDEEAKANKKLANLTQDNQKKLDENTIKKEKELEDHKESLRKEGQATLETAKQDAMKEFKKITEEEDQNRSSLISKAKSKNDDAVKKILTAFEKHLAL